MCIQRVEEVYTTCCDSVYNVLRECIQRVYNVYTTCCDSVYNVYTTCIQRVYNVYTTCIQRVYNVLREFIQRVYNVYTTCCDSVYNVLRECIQQLCIHRFNLDERVISEVQHGRLSVYPWQVPPLPLPSPPTASVRSLSTFALTKRNNASNATHYEKQRKHRNSVCEAQ